MYQNKIIKSILMFQLEQLSTIYKDILYLKSIINFVGSKGNFNSTVDQTLDDADKILKETNDIIKQKSEIINAIIKNSKYEKIITSYFVPSNDIEISIFIDHNRLFLDKILIIYKAIGSKIYQYVSKLFPEQETKPNVSSRYSSANFMKLIDKTFKERFKEFLKDNNSSDIKFDDIRFNVRISFKQGYALREISDKVYDLTLSYWHFEIPSIYNVATTHELGHLILKNGFSKEYNFRSLYLKLSEIIKKAYLDLDGNLGIDIDLFIQDLLDEVFADFIALSYHGTSYFLTQFHLLYADDLKNQSGLETGMPEFGDKDFWNDLTENYKVTVWDLSDEKRKKFLRLALSIYFIELLEGENKNKFFSKVEDTNIYFISDAKKALNIIFPIFYFDKDSLNFKQIYERFFDLKLEYEYDLKFVIKILKIFEEWDIKQLLLKIYNDTLKNISKSNQKEEKLQLKSSLPIFTNDLWKKWFKAVDKDKIVQKVYFRKKAHRKSLEILYRAGYIRNYSDIKPYKLQLNKIYNQNSGDLNQDNHYWMLGYYDEGILQELDEEYKPKFKDNGMIENGKLSTNYSLFQIVSPFVKDKNFKCNTSLLVEIDITSGDLIDIIQRVCILSSNCNIKFSSLRIFKSLGPCDLVVLFENVDINDIEEIKLNLLKVEDITTRSRILFKKYDFNLKNTNAFFKTQILNKLDNSSNERDFIQKNSKYFFMTPGIFDYEVIWNDNVKLKDIKDNLKDIEKNTYIVFSQII